jgi:large subunit ribosomal protein L23
VEDAVEHRKRILVRPIITEKGSILKERDNKYIFEVSRDSNKIEIKQAVEKMFNVTVTDVRTMNVRGKLKRLGVHSGKRPDWKKAIVTLKKDDQLSLFEGV